MTDYDCLIRLLNSLGLNNTQPEYETFRIEGPSKEEPWRDITSLGVPQGNEYWIIVEDGKFKVIVGPGSGPEWPPHVEFVFDKDGKAISHSVFG